MPEIKNTRISDPEDERPPLFKSWGGWYGSVLLVLAVLILFFYLFTKYYA